MGDSKNTLISRDGFRGLLGALYLQDKRERGELQRLAEEIYPEIEKSFIEVLNQPSATQRAIDAGLFKITLVDL